MLASQEYELGFISNLLNARYSKIMLHDSSAI